MVKVNEWIDQKVRSLEGTRIWNQRSSLISGISVGLLSVLIGSLILLINGYSPIEAYLGIIKGSFGSSTALSETLIRTTPLIFTGLAVAIPFRAGLFNIGGEGQLVVGALASAMVGVCNLGLPPLFHIGISLLAGMVVGALWAGFAGFLKASFGAHEVIITIMMNYLAILLTGYLVNYPWLAKDSWTPQSELIQPSAEIPTIFFGSQISLGLVIALAAIIFYAFILKYTVFGFELRAVGQSPTSAETAGIRSKPITIIAMLIAGALAGLGGGIEALGVYHRFLEGLSSNLGYDGVAVSVAAGGNPWGIILTSLLFGALKTGGAHLDRATSLPGDFGTLIQGLVIIFAAAPKMLIYIRDRRR